MSWDEVGAVAGGAFGIALVGYAEAVTVARSTATAHGYAVRPDREHLLALARRDEPRAGVLLLDLAASSELDVESVDMLAELRMALEREGVALRLANVRAPVFELLRRSGLADDLGPNGVVATPEAAIADARELTPGG